ncbi:UNVERIFIED_CONTAM: hypothetical protein Sradi_3229600 [Sesamum radiatum]|uniref:DUF8040 domain-containing protein n=1 Tax=Sesamum radiatum TaxID=300843 RepID=A0AAW2RIE6_SESRA
MLFSDVAATGERARAPSQRFENEFDSRDEMLEDDGESNRHEEEQVEIGDCNYTENIGIAKSNIAGKEMFPSLETMKRKYNGEQSKGKKKISGAASLKEDINSLLQFIANKSSATSSPSTLITIGAAIEILSNIPGIEPRSDLWNYAYYSLMNPRGFCDEEINEDENRVEHEIDWTLCQVTARSILTYYENYLHKVPCRTSMRTGHQFLEEVLHGHEIRCYQAFRLVKSVFLDLCHELTHKYDLQPTRGIHFHRVLKVVGKLANDIIRPHTEYNEGKGYHRPQHQRYKPFFDDCIGAIDGTHVKARLPQGQAIPYMGRKGNIIERTFGVWKARWNILCDMPYFHIDTQREIVLATMAIHNYIRKKNVADKAFQIAEDESYEPCTERATETSNRVATVEDEGNPISVYWIALRDSIAMEIARRC